MAKKPKAEKATEQHPLETTGDDNKVVKTITTREFLRHDYTQEEINQKGRKLAQLGAEKGALEDDKKASASDFKAKIDGKIAEMNILQTEINNGYGNCYVDCRTVMNDPNTGVKTVYRNDTNEIVRTESMSQSELQLDIFDQPVDNKEEERIEDAENDDTNNP